MSELAGKALLIHALNTVDVFQKNYVEVHDIVLNQRIGAELDYDNLLAALQQVHEVLVAGREVLDEDIETMPNVEDARHVISFIDALVAAVRKLREITRQLEQVSRGQLKYSFWRYRADIREYRKLVKAYQKEGEAINSVYASLFASTA